MEKLTFETGIKTFAINGDENRTISIDVTDANLMVRLEEVQSKFVELEEKYQNVDLTETQAKLDFMKAMEKEIKDSMNYLFNSDVYDTIFNGSSPFSMVNGKMLFERVFEAITPIVVKYAEEEEKKINKRVAKYQKEYK